MQDCPFEIRTLSLKNKAAVYESLDKIKAALVTNKEARRSSRAVEVGQVIWHFRMQSLSRKNPKQYLPVLWAVLKACRAESVSSPDIVDA